MIGITCPKCGHEFSVAGKIVGSAPAGAGPIHTRDRKPAAGAAVIVRSFYSATKLRAAKGADGKTHLTGHFAVFNSPSQPVAMKTSDGKTKVFIEKIAPGAFDRAITAVNGGADKALVHKHDDNSILARTGAKTLTLAQDDKGVTFDAVLGDTTLARDVAADVDHGNIPGMSFGFGNPTYEWDIAPDGTPIGTLVDLDLDHVSTTPYPAYTGTSVDVDERAVRSIEQAIERLGKGEKQFRCGYGGGYGDFDGNNSQVRSTCQRAQRDCREAHDSMERALAAVANPTNALNDHEKRAVRDMMGHVRQMIGKVAHLRSVCDPLDDDEADWPTTDPEGATPPPRVPDDDPALAGSDATMSLRHKMIDRAAAMGISPSMMEQTLRAGTQLRAGHMTHGDGAPALNAAGVDEAKKLIAAGKVDDGEWSFTADDENTLLGDPADWEAYGKWFLAEDKNAAEKTKARFKYPFGKAGKVYTRALNAVRSRASGQEAKSIFDAAGELLKLIKPNAAA